MGIFSLFDARKSSKAGSHNPNLASVPPDERPSWGKVTHGEYERDVKRHLREELGERKAAIVEAAIDGSINERGADRGMGVAEIDETMGVLTEERHKLGLSKDNLADIQHTLDREL